MRGLAALSGGYVTLAAIAVLGCAFRWLWWRCLLRRVLFGVFELRWLPQPALPLSWIAATEGALALAVREVWPRDAVTGWAWGEHSAPDVGSRWCSACCQRAPARRLRVSMRTMCQSCRA